MSGTDRRQQLRVNLPGPLFATVTRGEEVRVVNLSPAGAMIQHAEPLPFEEVHKLFLRLSGMEVQVPAQVVWSHSHSVQPDPKNPPRVAFRSGLRFAWLPRYAELKLRHYLATLPIQQG